jgi:hypothetical protein
MDTNYESFMKPNGLLPGEHWAINITNIHFIHAGLNYKRYEVSIYLIDETSSKVDGS